MDKLKKDLIIFYLLRNLFATFVITVITFTYNFTNYYHMSFNRAFVKIFVDNFYTLVYFLLLWIFNYLLFEIYKILIDSFKMNKKHRKIIINGKEIISYGSLIPLISLIIIFFINFNSLFKTNFILLIAFMLIRSIKEEIKQRKK